MAIRTNGTTTFHELTPAEIAFAEELTAYWLSFVRSGNPNRFKLARSPLWTKYSSKDARIVLQAVPNDSTSTSGSYLETEDDEESRRCLLIAGQANQQQN